MHRYKNRIAFCCYRANKILFLEDYAHHIFRFYFPFSFENNSKLSVSYISKLNNTGIFEIKVKNQKMFKAVSVFVH